MPIVNGRKIPFDPYELARLIHFGHDVQPDVNDAEPWDTQQQRILTASDIILKNLYHHFPETYWNIMGVEPRNNLKESGPANQLWRMKEIGNRVISNNTVFPTKLVAGDFFSKQIIEDYMKYKPKPEKDVLLIIGDGMNVLQDLEDWYKLADGIVPYDTMCVNYSALIGPHPIQHYAAGDAHMPDMKRVADSLPSTVLKHAWNPGCNGIDIRWLKNGRGGWSGTSANLAFEIGMAFDYTRMGSAVNNRSRFKG